LNISCQSSDHKLSRGGAGDVMSCDVMGCDGM
jgi:hypothetical protein